MRIWAVPGILLSLALTRGASQPEITVTVAAAKLTRTSIDRKIYGALLEHLGQGMDTMWAELLQDNSFEGFRPFTAMTENWAEGKVDSRQFWWHSGYELHPWRCFGTDSFASVNTSFGANVVNGIQGGAEKLDVTALVDDTARRLVCTLVHGNAAGCSVRLDLRQWPQVRPEGRVVTLASSSLENRSDFHTPDSVTQRQATIAGERGLFVLTLPPYSVTKVSFELR